MFATLVEKLQELDNEGVTERLRNLELERRRIEAETSALISVAQARRVPRDDGHHGVAGWLRANLNWSGAQITAAKRAAQLLDEHETVGDALLTGHIGNAQVAELARAARNPRCGGEIDEVLDLLLEHGEQLPFDDFRRVVRRWETLADEDGTELDDEANENNRTASLHERDGAIDLTASGGSAMTTAEMLGVFEQFVEAEFRQDVAARTELHGADAPASLLPRTDAQRRFDALHEIFLLAVSAPPGSRAPEPIVNILVDQHTHEVLLARHRLVPFPDDINEPDLSRMRCETDNGMPVPPETVFQATMQGYVRRIVVDDDGVVLNMGRQRRLFTGGARTAIKLMECHCGHLGCTVSSHFADIDHIDEWDRDGGFTDVDNGRPRCNGHNRAKTRLGLVDKRTRGGRIVTYRRDGTPMLPVGCRPPDDDEPDEIDDSGLARLARQLRPLLDQRTGSP
ncbi:MAG TPA: DUF222 domain-containing protein [Ilumatobacteraceae bacterium]|nr:DUF222 domain-containing protein [Ilumatobacteraceae bacterium]